MAGYWINFTNKVSLTFNNQDVWISKGNSISLCEFIAVLEVTYRFLQYIATLTIFSESEYPDDFEYFAKRTRYRAPYLRQQSKYNYIGMTLLY